MSDSNTVTAAPRSAADIRAAAKSAQPRSRGVILVPEWGGPIYVRTMSGDERDAFDRETVKRRKKARDRIRVRERLVIATATDEPGVAIFQADDEDTLAAKDVGPVDKVFKMAARLNGFIDDEDEAGN